MPRIKPIHNSLPDSVVQQVNYTLNKDAYKKVFQSPNIHSATYNTSTNILSVTFNSGATYCHQMVPISVWLELSETIHPTRYYKSAIVPNYPRLRTIKQGI